MTDPDFEVVDMAPLMQKPPRVYKHDAACRAAMELPVGKGVVVDPSVYGAFKNGGIYAQRFPQLALLQRSGRFILYRKPPQEANDDGQQND